MQRFWLTAHWPSQTDEPKERRNVYLQDKHTSVARELSAGDRVAIYEYQSNAERRLIQTPGGQAFSSPRRAGRRGIVTIADVAEPFIAVPPSEAKQTYSDGREMTWGWKATTENHAFAGFVPRSELIRLLNARREHSYARLWELRSFGIKNSRLLELSARTFGEIEDAFGQRQAAEAIALKGQTGSRGGGIESDAHYELKCFVAAHPERFWHERSTLHHIEFPYPTCDRADVVLRHPRGRFCCLEIEVEQGDQDVVGLMQALKYRAMLPVIESLESAEEVDAALVAYRISRSLRAKCEQHRVACHAVARTEVMRWWQEAGERYFGDTYRSI